MANTQLNNAITCVAIVNIIPCGKEHGGPISLIIESNISLSLYFCDNTVGTYSVYAYIRCDDHLTVVVIIIWCRISSSSTTDNNNNFDTHTFSMILGTQMRRDWRNDCVCPSASFNKDTILEQRRRPDGCFWSIESNPASIWRTCGGVANQQSPQIPTRGVPVPVHWSRIQILYFE